MQVERREDMEAKYFNEIEFKMIKKLFNLGYGFSESENIIYQLSWYIKTGRCTTERLKKIICATSRQLTTISKMLAGSGSQDECLSRAIEYIDKLN